MIKDKSNPYVMLNKTFLNDSNLTAKAKGILSYLLSLPDDWKIYEDEIITHFADGRDSIRNGIKELINNGYIEKERVRNQYGQLKGCNYSVYEIPTKNVKSNVGDSNTGESNITNNNLTNNDLTEYKKDDGILSGDKNTVSFSYKNLDVIKAMKLYMNDLYRQKTKRKHPFLKPEQYHAVYESLTAFCEEWGTEYQGLTDMMCKFLNTKTIQSDWNINHFATEGIMLNRMYEVAY